MSGLGVGIVVLLLVAAVVAGSLVMGAPVFAVPIVFVIFVIWGGVRVASAREGRDGPGGGRGDGERGGIEFTEGDRRTLTPASAIPPGRPGSERAG